jgi:hypothetical protein|nr:MAG TPA: RNA polymerase sigma factor [Caudoviricetes sp.]
MSTKHYVTKQMLQAEWDLSLKADKCSDKLLNMFRKIANHVATIFVFNSISDRNAIIEAGVLVAWEKWKTYDIKKTDNIFSYFTTIILNGMRGHYKEITKHKAVNISIEALFSGNKNQ